MSEAEIGIVGYLSEGCRGTGGRLKTFPEDFIVEEIPIDIPEDKDGRYTLAFVRARNWETNRLVRQLARALGISRRRIYFAGTKDKRAVSTQAMVFDAPMEDVLSIRIRDVSIIKAYRTSRPIFLGDLKGNRFEIIVRETGEDAEEGAICTRKVIEEHRGFPNFFGVQRFGSIRPITHIVGRYILMREYRKAIEAYLGNPSELEGEEAYEARRFFQETGDVREALKIFPENLMFERAMLNHLVENPGDYAGAIAVLPENLARMFIHAYQSYLFNRILSRRLEEGLEPRIGDMVVTIEDGMIVERETFPVREHNLEKIRRRFREGKAFPTGIVFGSEPLFAGGMQGEIEREIIDEEGLRPEDFVFQDMDFLSSKGGRRALLSPVNDLELSFGERTISLRFWLPKGCYATSLLREFMKVQDMKAYG